MFKKCKALTAFLLAVIMIFVSVPGGVFSLESDELTNKSGMTSVMPGELSGFTELSQEFADETLIGKVVEDRSLRDENVKHFRLDNGTFEAVMYPYPVHRQDSDGVWQDIDNSLTLKKDGILKVYETPDSRVKFADSFKSNSELYRLSENGYSISMELIENEPSKFAGILDSGLEEKSKIIVSNAEKYSAESAFDSLEQAAKVNNKSSVLYSNVRANTDIQYILQGNDIKENIIVKASGESYEYRFGIDLVGLTASLDGSGVINLYDAESGELKYIMPAPYMYDSNGEYSNDVSYDIQHLRDGIYLLTVKADAKWINSKDRAFPVVIDPTLTQDRPVFDSYTDSLNPDGQYQLSEKLWVSNSETSYIYMNVSDLPTTATVNSATLYVSYYYNITTGSLLAGAYQVNGIWSDSTITYNHSPAVSATCLSTATMIAASVVTRTNPGWAQFDITNAAVSWYNNPSTNHGIAIKRIPSTTSTNQSVILKSYEAGNDYAYISINYINYIPNGVYAFRSKLNQNRWIKVQDGSTSEGKNLQQVYSTESPASNEVFDRSCLFKIYNIPGTVCYVIRSMVNNSLTFDISGSKFVTKKIPDVDANVPFENLFYINWDGYGFRIRPCYSEKVVNMTSISTPELSTLNNSDAGWGARWDLVRYTGENKYGYVMNRTPNSDTSYPGTLMTFTPYVWSTLIDYNTPYMSIDSEGKIIAAFTWNSSSCQGNAYYGNPGTLNITVSILKGSNPSLKLSLTLRHTIKLLIENGSYLVMNRQAGKYMQLDDGDAPNFNNENGIAEIHQFDGENYQRWKLTYLGDGYYSIISVKNGKAITVPSGKETSDNTDLLLKPFNANSDNQKWKITLTRNGSYKIKAKSSEDYTSKDLVMDLESGTLVNGLNIRQREYMDNSSYRDEWYLYNISSCPTQNVDLIYDNAYGIRYTNAYSRIQNNMTQLREWYWTNFGLWVEYREPNAFQSYTDQFCNTDPNALCECADDAQCHNSIAYTNGTINYSYLHHNNIFNIIYRIPLPAANSAKIAFIGHITCAIDESGEHFDYPYYGLTDEYLRLITVMNFDSTSSEIKTTIHEFGHLFNAPDHYDKTGEKTTKALNEKYPGYNFSDDCIYGLNHNSGSVINGRPICDGCRKMIQDKINAMLHG